MWGGKGEGLSIQDRVFLSAKNNEWQEQVQQHQQVKTRLEKGWFLPVVFHQLLRCFSLLIRLTLA